MVLRILTKVRTMMGHREKMVGGAEYDALSPRARKIICFKRGEIRKCKRKFNKRIRYIARRDADVQAEA